MTRLFAPLVAILWLSSQPVLAQELKIEQCSDRAEYSELDFWLGEWEVFADGKNAGNNRIEKILNGCIVMEHWVGAGGDQGKSIFFYDLAKKTWKQLWFTQWANRPGGIKEKILIKKFPNGGIRFQGLIIKPDGGTYLDRTTLTPLVNGDVWQLIEVSEDDGETWQSVFDAVYKRRLTPGPDRG